MAVISGTFEFSRPYLKPVATAKRPAGSHHQASKHPSYKMENPERAAQILRILGVMEREKRMAEKCRQQRAINQRKKVIE